MTIEQQEMLAHLNAAFDTAERRITQPDYEEPAEEQVVEDNAPLDRDALLNDFAAGKIDESVLVAAAEYEKANATRNSEYNASVLAAFGTETLASLRARSERADTAAVTGSDIYEAFKAGR